MNGRIREYTREECPVCGHREWCGRRDDGLVLCRRPPTPREVPGFTYKGMARDGATGMYVEVGRELVQPRAPQAADVSQRESPRADSLARPSEPTSGDRVDPKWLSANYPRLVANLTDDRRVILAEALNLPLEAMEALAIGWWTERRWWNPETQQYEGEPGCWTFPECDAHGRIIGLGLRWPTGRKGQMSGGRRGLILPDGWRDVADPALVVEGPSDVLAGRAVGLNVVGRPNNTGGAELLAQVYRNRRVIVLGENDRKPDGRWPGREGAKAVAGRLSDAWGWPVPVAYPPGGQKDLRAWVVADFATLGCAPDDDEIAAIRARILQAVQPPAVLLMTGPRTRRGGKVSVKAFHWARLPDGGAFYTDKLDLDSARSRARFTATVAEHEPAVDPTEIERQLLELHVPEVQQRERADVTSNSAPSGGATMLIVSGSNDRPCIQGNERQLRDIRNDALAALIKANSPFRLFSRARGIARIALLPNDQREITPCMQQLDADALRGELTNSADWITLKHTKEGEIRVPDVPPLMVARDILALPSVELPPLIAIITCPTFARDGGLITAAGYDSASRLWHHLTLADLPAIPESPTREEIVAARDALLDILADFPFVDRASCANAIALMLLPFVRPLIDGPTPMHAVDAPSPATGKDLLAKAALFPALGYAVGVMTAAKDPDEWRKKISSALVAGNPAIVWGNIAQRLDSEHLAAVLTDVVWKDRLLGYTRELTLPNSSVWVCTGNNLSFSKELARRVVWIRLDAKLEAPETRSGFRHPNLLAHVSERRASLVAAALTLVRAWLAAGRPAGKQILGSFEDFVAVLGGILDVAGIEGFLANADELRRRADTETSEWRAFVSEWWERWHDAYVGVSDLSELLWSDGKRTDLLTSVVRSETQRGAVTQLGMRLARKRDCIIAGLRVVVGDKTDHKDRLVYRLVPTFSDPTEGRHKVGTKVGSDKTHADSELEANADLRRPFGDPLRYTCANNTHAYETRAFLSPAETRSNGKRSAEVGIEAQPAEETQVTRADLDADLSPTLGSDAVRSASTAPPATPACSPVVTWLTDDSGNHIPPNIRELAQHRAGWTPSSWRDRLLQLAERCADLNPERAAELRMAAAAMTHEKQGGRDVQRDA